MEVSNIKCNGIRSTIAAQSSIPTINTLISLFRMRFKESEIFEKFPKNDEYYPGIRFNDDNTVALRIASALVEEAEKELRCNDNSIIDGYIHLFVDSLNGMEMDQLIIEGMRDCASADHWYKFGKQWS
jgi:hypothetical protein